MYFKALHKSLHQSGLGKVPNDCIICPLCWTLTQYADLRLEHIVPGSVGGRRDILSCERCNNSHGSSLDSQLKKYQEICDAFNGLQPIRATMSALGNNVKVNMQWGSRSNNIQIVDKASNPAAVQALMSKGASGEISEYQFKLGLGYTKSGFRRALIRCAYLALFRKFGYSYVKHEAPQFIRRLICESGRADPKLRSIVAEVRGANFPYNVPYFLVPVTIGNIDCALVFIRLRRLSTSIHAVYMPNTSCSPASYMDVMDRWSAQADGATLTLPLVGVFN